MAPVTDSPGVEVERKFLLAEVPAGLKGRPRKKIRQGYLAVTAEGLEVRVRKAGKRHFLTVKGGGGESRVEEEIPIGRRRFKALWPLTEGRRAFKVRYKVRCGKRTVEVDVYRGPLEGLVTAEVEFPDEESAREFRPPDWLGREVTGDERYKNESLARYGAPEAEGASRDVPTEA